MIRLDILLIGAGIFFLVVVGFYFIEEPERDTKRGCIASAYQAEHKGFDLEMNLAECE